MTNNKKNSHHSVLPLAIMHPSLLERGDTVPHRWSRKCLLVSLVLATLMLVSIRQEFWTTRQLLFDSSSYDRSHKRDSNVVVVRLQRFPETVQEPDQEQRHPNGSQMTPDWDERDHGVIPKPKSRLTMPPSDPLDRGALSGANTTGSSSARRGTKPKDKQYKRVVVLEGGSAASTSNVSRTVEPLAAPPSTWDEGDVTRGYPTADSSDEGVHMEVLYWPEKDTPEEDPHCEPLQAWQSQQFPACNSLHEQAIMSQMTLLKTDGYSRNVWRQEESVVLPQNGTSRNQTLIWKTLKLRHNMEQSVFEKNRVDALAMERLTGSPYIINMFGFCGMTVVQEFAGRTIHSVPIETDPKEKLEVMTMAAQAIADVHSIDGLDQPPSLVHNDINPANLIMSNDGRPVLNDYNIAILLKKHNETGEICPFTAKYTNPQWRAPEEQIDNTADPRPLVTEKVDVYGLGNIMYRMLVGHAPWKVMGHLRMTDEDKARVVQSKRNGTLPFIPPELRNSTNPFMARMREAMFQCYRANATQRPSAREILAFLKKGPLMPKETTTSSPREEKKKK